MSAIGRFHCILKPLCIFYWVFEMKCVYFIFRIFIVVLTNQKTAPATRQSFIKFPRKFQSWFCVQFPPLFLLTNMMREVPSLLQSFHILLVAATDFWTDDIAKVIVNLRLNTVMRQVCGNAIFRPLKLTQTCVKVCGEWNFYASNESKGNLVPDHKKGENGFLKIFIALFYYFQFAARFCKDS